MQFVESDRWLMADLQFINLAFPNKIFMTTIFWILSLSLYIFGDYLGLSPKYCQSILKKPTDNELYNTCLMLEGAQLRKLRICAVSSTARVSFA